MDKLSKVLVIGSGPIIIGQAAEFDYAGTQACKSLREEGIFTVLVNSNPATIMTDQDVADKIYIEPLNVQVLERVIAQERPEGILPTLGGQTGLNLAVELADAGVLERFGVRLLGTPLESIKNAEDRELFRDLLTKIGEPQPPSEIVSSVKKAKDVAIELGFPLVVRPAYTLGGTGGGFANNMEEFIDIANSGISASPVGQILVERSLAGWKEIEYEVMRDGADNCITVCNMENIDPMGVHTGDSIVVAPSQTLSDKEYQMLRSASIRIIRSLGIEGGCNVQFALQPHPMITNHLTSNWTHDSPYYVIEVNPRVSRSSALASKATGYPIARVAAKIAVGKLLSDIPNAVTKKTLAAFEPALDYCVVKIPRWPFDKFPTGDRRITTQMKATGEVMSIDRSFEAALQKAVRSLEIGGISLLWESPGWNMDDGPPFDDVALHPNDQRLWAVMASLRRGMSVEEVSERTLIDPWFIHCMQRIVNMERRLLSEKLTPETLYSAKRLGFSDEQIGTLADTLTERVRSMRLEWNIRPVYKMVDTCAAEFEAITPYFYSTYEEENEAEPIKGLSALVIGSGPIRIGQGIEFDYCSVHAAQALKSENYKSIMVNSNPETVSTDFDMSGRLYFEPLDEESLRDILDNETVDGETPPSVVQFGGQTAIDLSQTLGNLGLPILGSSADSIDIASDRSRFDEFMEQLGILQPPGGAVTSVDAALTVAENIGYPIIVRPSYVIGGRAMEIVQNAGELERYLTIATDVGHGRSVLVDKYLEGKECELDAICDGKDVLIPGVMEHIERAGVHSGDSMAIYPGLTLTDNEVATLVDSTHRIALALGIRGLMNIQFVITGGDVYRSPQTSITKNDTSIYVLEVNPRASRTVPFLSKVTGVPIVEIATKVMLGRTLSDMGYTSGLYEKQDLIAIKAPVFSMSKLTGVDAYLGPEMKSTGEVMGVDKHFRGALAKALTGSSLTIPPKSAVLLSISDRDKPDVSSLVETLVIKGGCTLFATEGTAETIKDIGVPVTMITKKLGEGHPNVVDIIKEGKVDAVINTVSEAATAIRDGFYIRRAAVERRIPCFTFLDTARAAAESLAEESEEYNVMSMDQYLA